MVDIIVRIIPMDGRIQLDSELVIKLRRNLGLSQFEMAMQCSELRLNLALSTIKRVETGKRILLRTARNMANFFQCSLESLTVIPNTTEQHLSEKTRVTGVIAASLQFESDVLNTSLKHAIDSNKLH
jgi:transcriptional regulator with XRE-family HTH domain